MPIGLRGLNKKEFIFTNVKIFDNGKNCDIM